MTTKFYSVAQVLVDFIKTECLSETADSTSSSSLINWSTLEERPIINVDFGSLKTSPILAQSMPGWPPTPGVGHKFDAKQFLSSLGLAVHTVASEKLYGSAMNPRRWL